MQRSESFFVEPPDGDQAGGNSNSIQRSSFSAESSTLVSPSPFSIEYEDEKERFERTQKIVATLIMDLAEFREKASLLDSAARQFLKSSRELMKATGVEESVGAPTFAAAAEAHERMLDLVNSAALGHSELLLATLKSKALPSVEAAKSAQKAAEEALKVRDSIAKEADACCGTSNLPMCVHGLHASGRFRKAAATFAQLHEVALEATIVSQAALSSALHSALSQVTSAQAAEIGELAKTLRRATQGMPPAPAPLADNDLTSDTAASFLMMTASTPAASTPAALSKNFFIESESEKDRKIDEALLRSSLFSTLSVDVVRAMRELKIQTLIGETIIARVERAREDSTGYFGVLIVSNYRIRFFGADVLLTSSSSSSLSSSSSASSSSSSSSSAAATADIDSSNNVISLDLGDESSHTYPSSSSSSTSSKQRSSSSSSSYWNKPGNESLEPGTRAMRRHMPLTIPLMAVNRLEVVGGPAGSLVFTTSDFRLHSFSFGATTADLSALVSMISASLWIGKGAFPFTSSFKMEPPPTLNGWTIYNTREEIQRLKKQAFNQSTNDRYNISAINKSYGLCESYPEDLILPTNLSEEQVRSGAKFRSKRRLPAISWFRGSISLARSSQPLTGVFKKRSSNDELLLSALIADPNDTAQARAISPVWSDPKTNDAAPSSLCIFDARPLINAVANAAHGGGTEIMSNYPFATLTYLNIDNIHVVREALGELRAYLVRKERVSLHNCLQSRIEARRSLAAASASSVRKSVFEDFGSLTPMAVATPTPSTPLRHLDSFAEATDSSSALMTTLESTHQFDSSPSSVLGMSDSHHHQQHHQQQQHSTNTAASRLDRVLMAKTGQSHGGTSNENYSHTLPAPSPFHSNLVHPLSPPASSAVEYSATSSTGNGATPRHGIVGGGGGSDSLTSNVLALSSPLPPRHGLGDSGGQWDASNSASIRRSHKKSLGHRVLSLFRGSKKKKSHDPSSSSSSSSSMTNSNLSSESMTLAEGEELITNALAVTAHKKLSTRVADAVRLSRPKPSAPHWIRLISTLLQGSVAVAAQLERGISVLVHCSDGWDRTSGLAAFAQLLVDPYFRTLHGMCVLLDKEWCSFGHKFARRCGTGASDHDRQDAVDGQRAPIFIQFLDCLWQLLRQQQRGSLEWNEAFLVSVAEHTYSACFGTFLMDCERERVEAGLHLKTQSLWSYIQHPMMRSRFVDPDFNASSNPYSTAPLSLKTGIDHLAIWPYWRTHFT